MHRSVAARLHRNERVARELKGLAKHCVQAALRLLAKCLRKFTSMRKSDFTTKPKRIFHPKCANCDVPMWLSQIENDMPDDHRRTFECPLCERVAIRVVKGR